MDLWLSFLALSIGVALAIAFVLSRSSRDRHTVLHDKTPPLGTAQRHANQRTGPTVRRSH